MTNSKDAQPCLYDGLPCSLSAYAAPTACGICVANGELMVWYACSTLRRSTAGQIAAHTIIIHSISPGTPPLGNGVMAADACTAAPSHTVAASSMPTHLDLDACHDQGACTALHCCTPSMQGCLRKAAQLTHSISLASCRHTTSQPDLSTQ